MSDKYLRVTLENVKRDDEDVLSSLCFDYGAEGVSEELEFEQTIKNFEPQIVDREFKKLAVFFTDRPNEELFLKIQSRFPEVKVVQNLEESKDWLEEWKKGYKPFSLVDETWVVPTWLEAPAEAKTVIWIDPGMAFGTGTHETTKAASQLISRQNLEGQRVLDVGTGTGILAFLCEKRGAGQIVGLEIDEEARRVARENAELNKTQNVEIWDQNIELVEEGFDLVIANIIDGILLKIRDHLFRNVSSSGRIILSGILEENEKGFLHDFLDGQDFQLQDRIQKGEWLALLLARK